MNRGYLPSHLIPLKAELFWERYSKITPWYTFHFSTGGSVPPLLPLERPFVKSVVQPQALCVSEEGGRGGIRGLHVGCSFMLWGLLLLCVGGRGALTEQQVLAVLPSGFLPSSLLQECLPTLSTWSWSSRCEALQRLLICLRTRLSPSL